jgi:hypothetical protein
VMISELRLKISDLGKGRKRFEIWEVRREKKIKKSKV